MTSVYRKAQKRTILTSLNAELADLTIMREQLVCFYEWFIFYFRLPWDNSNAPKLNTNFITGVKTLSPTFTEFESITDNVFLIKMNVGNGFLVEVSFSRYSGLINFIVYDYIGQYDNKDLEVKGSDVIALVRTSLLREVNKAYCIRVFNAFDKLCVNPMYLIDGKNSLFNIDTNCVLTNSLSYDKDKQQFIAKLINENGDRYDYALMDLKSATDEVRCRLLDGTLGVVEIYNHMALSEALLRHAYRIGDIYQTENVKEVLQTLRSNLTLFWNNPVA